METMKPDDDDLSSVLSDLSNSLAEDLEALFPAFEKLDRTDDNTVVTQDDEDQVTIRPLLGKASAAVDSSPLPTSARRFPPWRPEPRRKRPFFRLFFHRNHKDEAQLLEPIIALQDEKSTATLHLLPESIELRLVQHPTSPSTPGKSKKSTFSPTPAFRRRRNRVGEVGSSPISELDFGNGSYHLLQIIDEDFSWDPFNDSNNNITNTIDCTALTPTTTITFDHGPALQPPSRLNITMPTPSSATSPLRRSMESYLDAWTAETRSFVWVPPSQPYSNKIAMGLHQLMPTTSVDTESTTPTSNVSIIQNPKHLRCNKRNKLASLNGNTAHLRFSSTKVRRTRTTIIQKSLLDDVEETSMYSSSTSRTPSSAMRTLPISPPPPPEEPITNNTADPIMQQLAQLVAQKWQIVAQSVASAAEKLPERVSEMGFDQWPHQQQQQQQQQQSPFEKTSTDYSNSGFFGPIKFCTSPPIEDMVSSNTFDYDDHVGVSSRFFSCTSNDTWHEIAHHPRQLSCLSSSVSSYHQHDQGSFPLDPTITTTTTTPVEFHHSDYTPNYEYDDNNVPCEPIQSDGPNTEVSLQATYRSRKAPPGSVMSLSERCDKTSGDVLMKVAILEPSSSISTSMSRKRLVVSGARRWSAQHQEEDFTPPPTTIVMLAPPPSPLTTTTAISKQDQADDYEDFLTLPVIPPLQGRMCDTAAKASFVATIDDPPPCHPSLSLSSSCSSEIAAASSHYSDNDKSSFMDDGDAAAFRPNCRNLPHIRLSPINVPASLTNNNSNSVDDEDEEEEMVSSPKVATATAAHHHHRPLPSLQDQHGITLDVIDPGEEGDDEKDRYENNKTPPNNALEKMRQIPNNGEVATAVLHHHHNKFLHRISPVSIAEFGEI